MAVSGVKSDKSKPELIEEIVKLKKELKEKDGEIALLKKKLALYRDLK
jgi:predicted RNase H-like nuclease (RuvC/YqgF family)